MEKKSLLMFGFSLLSAMMMLYIISMLGLFLNKRPGEELNFNLVFMLQILVFLSPVAFISTFFKVNFLELIKLKFNLNSKIIIYSIAGLLFLDLMNSSILSIQDAFAPPFLKEIIDVSISDSQKFYSQLFLINNWYEIFIPIFIGAVLPAICEETFFRGLLQTSLSHYSKWTMIMVPSILFGLFHGQIAFLIPQILIGIYLAILTYYSGSIVPAIIVHFLNNFKAIMMMNIFGIDNQNLDLTLSIILLPVSIYLLLFVIKLIKN